ncbi:MAG: DegT/DnrJ/EryC1/StrS aminotransferase family protein [Alphaproteobacteria bacterium]|nr:DegT/DnrJ/EryC1/StrS aminotransferase family protein [Alphaproteobacteria bacterium]
MTLARTRPAPRPIAFIDLAAQQRRLGAAIEGAIGRVLAHGQYIMGPEVAAFERALQHFTGAAHVVSCANGTDALVLALRAHGIGVGDAVFVPAFTFAATAGAVALCGATPVFVDVLPDTFALDPASLAHAVVAPPAGLHPAAVIAVDLFGQPADYPALRPIASAAGLRLIADAAQSCGAALHGAAVGTLAEMTTTSFFPAKPLGCYGDGGAVFTADAQTAELVASLRQHGRGSAKYDTRRVGMNSRLDTVQGAILIEKLKAFPGEIACRQRVAERYHAALSDVAQVPRLAPGATSVWAQYTLQLDDRDDVAERLKAAGVPTAVYYPTPLNETTAFATCPTVPGGTPVARDLARRVLSLPMHPDLDEGTQDRVVAAVRSALGLR